MQTAVPSSSSYRRSQRELQAFRIFIAFLKWGHAQATRYSEKMQPSKEKWLPFDPLLKKNKGNRDALEDWANALPPLPGLPPHLWAWVVLFCHPAWTQLDHFYRESEITGLRMGEKWRIRAHIFHYAHDLHVSSMQTKLAHFITAAGSENEISVLGKSPGSYISFHTE